MTDDVRWHARAADLLALHHTSAPLVLPNVWDGGSARLAEEAGFAALATTSAGIAFSHGVRDGALERGPMMERIAQIVAVAGVPVTADLESGYGPEADDVARTVAEAVGLGVVGANLEDVRDGELLEVEKAHARLEAAREAAPRGTFVLNARTDTYLVGVPDAFAETVRRAEAYVEAGADCVFVPGVGDADTIGRLVAAVPAPLNVVAGLTAAMPSVGELGQLGVARVSVGGSLARAALAYVETTLRSLHGEHDLSFTMSALGHADLQRRFSSRIP
ncbi:isocitrate lyase/PEP mutase family protein [Mumia sp. DW29H23]|uniref:isocitrate lyase/PEP mutase family protein n=1 Tax=Mumia sp. DW29H23 TaxID=3421241 RepID=UPI003D680E8D